MKISVMPTAHKLTDEYGQVGDQRLAPASIPVRVKFRIAWPQNEGRLLQFIQGQQVFPRRQQSVCRERRQLNHLIDLHVLDILVLLNI